MFPQEPPASGPFRASRTPGDEMPADDGGMFYVDFGAYFGQELQKVLRYRQTGMFCELMFWQDEYRF